MEPSSPSPRFKTDNSFASSVKIKKCVELKLLFSVCRHDVLSDLSIGRNIYFVYLFILAFDMIPATEGAKDTCHISN
jgi:hypothetical protein